MYVFRAHYREHRISWLNHLTLSTCSVLGDGEDQQGAVSVEGGTGVVGSGWPDPRGYWWVGERQVVRHTTFD